MIPAAEKHCLLVDLPFSDKLDGLEHTVNNLKQKYKQLWWETDTIFPDLAQTYSRKRKKEIEQETNNFLEKLANHPKSKSVLEYYSDLKTQQKSAQQVRDIERFCKLAGLYIDKPFADGFDRSTKIFLEKIKLFDPSLGPDKIYQAMRNLWIMNSLQVLMNLEMNCSDSMFAYSMLYPYTDNINDDVSMSIDAKLSMNQSLRRWLEGDFCPYRNETERKIFLLVKMIEQEFPRSKFHGVFQSLLAIYNAQIKSLIQHKQHGIHDESDILDISFEKGGTSVLADGYLIRGILNETVEDFCFGYGAFLQFADDIQDVKDDLKNSHLTLFSQMAGKCKLDQLANKLFNYISTIVDLHLSAPALKRLRELILNNCYFLVLETIGKNRQFYSRKYTKEIEAHFPFSFSFFDKTKKRLKLILLKADRD